MDHLLSFLIFLPLLVAAIILAVPARFSQAIKALTLGVSIIELGLSLVAWFKFLPSETGYQFVEKADWFGLQLSKLGFFQVQYFLGVDGLSIAMVLLTGIIGVIG